MWPFKKKQKELDSSIVHTDAIISRALMGNQDAWDKILSDESQTLLEATAGTVMSFIIIHRWGNQSEKEEHLAPYNFINFVINKYADDKSLPRLDDDELWEATQEVIRNCPGLLSDREQLPDELKKCVDDANKAPAVHDGSLLAAMMNPIGNITSKAKEIGERVS